MAESKMTAIRITNTSVPIGTWSTWFDGQEEPQVKIECENCGTFLGNKNALLIHPGMEEIQWQGTHCQERKQYGTDYITTQV